MLRINAVSISDIKGIEALKFTLGTLTIVKGANGAGKSSILDAISAVFDGGHDPDLLRRGTEKGCVELQLSDGTMIRKTITAKRSTVDILNPDSLPVKRPAEFLAKLASGFAFDPIAFLNADPKKRAQFLLEAMPISFHPAEISGVTGRTLAKPLDLDGFMALRQAVYDQRRDANVLLRDIGATVQTLRQALPTDDDVHWADKVDSLRERKAQLTAELTTTKELVGAQLARQLDAIASELNGALTTSESVYQQAIAEARIKRDESNLAAMEKADELRQGVKQEAQAALDEQTAQNNADMQTVVSDIAQAEERAAYQRKAEQTRNNIKEYSAKLDGKVMESTKLDGQLAALDALKLAKLAESAIPGVTVEHGQIFVDGLNFDSQVNTAKQMFVAFQVCSLKAGDLGFMVADGAEALVGQDWEDFMAAASESGFQVLTARAEAGADLEVEVV